MPKEVERKVYPGEKYATGIVEVLASGWVYGTLGLAALPCLNAPEKGCWSALLNKCFGVDF